MKNKICLKCGNEYISTAGRQKYCAECRKKYKYIRSGGKIFKRHCDFCNKYYEGYREKYCSRSCSAKDLQKKGKIHRFPKGVHSPNWKEGKMHSMGYIYIYKPNHPDATKAGYVFEHRLAMEKYLGRRLRSDEMVHHKNAKKDDNRMENLELKGRPHFGRMKCPYCRKEFRIL